MTSLKTELRRERANTTASGHHIGAPRRHGRSGSDHLDTVTTEATGDLGVPAAVVTLVQTLEERFLSYDDGLLTSPAVRTEIAIHAQLVGALRTLAGQDTQYERIYEHSAGVNADLARRQFGLENMQSLAEFRARPIPKGPAPHDTPYVGMNGI